MMDQSTPVALIFRTRLLPYSETFIRSQAEAMKTYRPFFVGFRQTGDFECQSDSAWIANRGGVAGLAREFQARLWGPGPRLLTRLCALKPALLHAHFGPDACEAIRFASRLRIPLIATFHGYDATCRDSRFNSSTLDRRYLSRRNELTHKGSLFLAVSQFIRKKLLERGMPMDRVLVHYIGVDVSKFRATGLASRRQCVLFTGRLIAKKGCSYLIKAMKVVQSVLPNAELVVIGDGDQRQRLETEAQQSLHNFKFLGAQPSSVVKEWMQKARVFCVPSVTAPDGDAEGFGIVFAEAQACGLPVVSFASGGITEAVAHGETGFLAQEGNWGELADYVLLLLESNEIWERFSRAGRKRVEEHFDLHRQTAKLETIYQQVSYSYRTGRSSALGTAVGAPLGASLGAERLAGLNESLN